MKKDSKIIIGVTVSIAALAILFVMIFGAHYLFENPARIVVSPDMKAFTVCSGGDYTTGQIADYIRRMRKTDEGYLRISEKLYCSENADGFTRLDKLMASLGYEYIGSESTSINLRCYYKNGKARWVRIEYDLNNVWTLWNLGDEFEYDLAKEGYKTMNF